MSSVEEDGAVHVEGEFVGRISGFTFLPESGGEGAGARALKAAALQAVATEIAARARAVAASPDTALTLTRLGEIVWNHAPVGRLEPGPAPLKPRAAILAGEQVSGAEREEVQARLQKFVDRHIGSILEPLVKLEDGEGLEGIARGIAFRLVETLGVVPRDQIAEEVRALSQDDRAKLRALGVRFGAINIYVPALLKPAPTELRLMLWALQLQKEGKLDLARLPHPPGQGLTSAAFDRTTPRGFYGVCGYRICGPRVVRIDMLERLADLIRDRVFWRPRFPEEPRPAGSVEGGGFTVVPDMMSLVGCSGEDFINILKSLDFRMQRKIVKRPVVAPPAEAVAQGSPDPESPPEIPVAPPSEVPPAPPQEDPPAPEQPPAEPPQELPPVTEPPAEPPQELPPVTEPPAEPPQELPPVTEPPAEPAVPQDVPPTTPQANDAPSAAAPADAGPALEDVEIEVWWPKDTGPFRQRTERQPEQRRQRQRPQAAVEQAQPADAAPRADARPPRPGRHKRKDKRPDRPEAAERQGHGQDERRQRRDDRPKTFESRPPKPEKPMDPNSPFAVLGALKAKLAGK